MSYATRQRLARASKADLDKRARQIALPRFRIDLAWELADIIELEKQLYQEIDRAQYAGAVDVEEKARETLHKITIYRSKIENLLKG